MGSYNFRWEHPAEEVYVTGTFDNWSKSVKLDKKDLVHEKMVNLPNAEEKVLYKFVADGDWKTDHTVKTEKDHEGNLNNVLYPDDIKPPVSQAATISTVGAGATTLGLAAAQPKESSRAFPGAFPETPAAEEKDEQQFSVAPIPATGGISNPITLAPGEPVPDPSTLTGNTVASTVKTDEASYERSDAGIVPVQPDPARDPTAAGLGPISESTIPESSMGMGKDAPQDISGDDTGPAIASVGERATTVDLAGQVPKEPRGTAEVVDDDAEKNESAAPANEEAKDDKKKDAGILAAAGVTIAGGAVAANELIKDKTGKDPKSALPESTQQKIDQTAEKKDAPATTSAPTESAKDAEVPASKSAPAETATEDKEEGKKEGGISGTATAGLAAAGVTAAGGALAANEYLKDKTNTSALPASAEQKLADTAKPTDDSTLPQQTTAGEAPVVPADAAAKETTSAVPKEVLASQKEAHEDSEAAANPDAVKEKSAVEDELLAKVPTSNAPGAPAPSTAGATTSAVPEEVLASQKLAHEDSEAAANPDAVKEKSAVEDELLAKVPTSNEQGEPAPTDSAATATTAPAPTSTSGAPQLADPVAGVGALSLDDNKTAAAPAAAEQSTPVVTTGIASASAPETSAATATPRPRGALSGADSTKRQSFIDRLKGTPESSKSSGAPSSPSDSKKEKRKSLFGRIKDKLKA